MTSNKGYLYTFGINQCLIEYINHKNRRLYNENLARKGPSSINVSQRIPSVDEGENELIILHRLSQVCTVVCNISNSLVFFLFVAVVDAAVDMGECYFLHFFRRFKFYKSVNEAHTAPHTIKVIRLCK